MPLDLDNLKDWGELHDWLECPSCGSNDCNIQQDPDTLYIFCNDCDHYADAELARWS